jgi:hypothetical protein
VAPSSHAANSDNPSTTTSSAPAQASVQDAAQQLASVHKVTSSPDMDSGKGPATAVVRPLQKEDSALGLVELQGSGPGLAGTHESGPSSSNCSMHAASNVAGAPRYQHADASEPAGICRQHGPGMGCSGRAAKMAPLPGAHVAGASECSHQQSSSTSCWCPAAAGSPATQPPQPSTSGTAPPAVGSALPQSTPAPGCMQQSAFARQDSLAAAVLSEVSQELPYLPADAASMAAHMQVANASATAAAEGVPAGMPPLPAGAASSSAVGPGQQVVLRHMGSSNNASSTGGSRRLRREDSYVSLGGLSEAHSTTLGEPLQRCSHLPLCRTQPDILSCLRRLLLCHSRSHTACRCMHHHATYTLLPLAMILASALQLGVTSSANSPCRCIACRHRHQ